MGNTASAITCCPLKTGVAKGRWGWGAEELWLFLILYERDEAHSVSGNLLCAVQV